MTLPMTFSYTGVKYTSWVRKIVASLKFIKAKSLGSKHMARSRPGEAGDAGWRIPTPWISRAVASGGWSPSSILPHLIWIIPWLLYHLGYSLLRAFFSFIHGSDLPRLFFFGFLSTLLSLPHIVEKHIKTTLQLFDCIHTSKINLVSNKIHCHLCR